MALYHGYIRRVRCHEVDIIEHAILWYVDGALYVRLLSYMSGDGDGASLHYII